MAIEVGVTRIARIDTFLIRYANAMFAKTSSKYSPFTA